MDDRIFKNLPPQKFDFWKFLKSTKFFFTMYTKRTCSQWKWKMGAKRPNSLVCQIFRSFIKQNFVRCLPCLPSGGFIQNNKLYIAGVHRFRGFILFLLMLRNPLHIGLYTYICNISILFLNTKCIYSEKQFFCSFENYI